MDEMEDDSLNPRTYCSRWQVASAEASPLGEIS
jgi:hypothetical protein